MKPAAPPDPLMDWRLLECTRCRDLIRSYEIPYPIHDPATYVCGQCLAEVGG